MWCLSCLAEDGSEVQREVVEPWVEASSLAKDSELAIFQLFSWDMRAAGSGKRPVG